jgi:hypothetical protein
MIHPSRRDRKAKAIVEVLAMIDATHPELSPPCPVRETDEGLAESATEFCAVLDRYAESAARIRREESLIRRSLRVRPPVPSH